MVPHAPGEDHVNRRALQRRATSCYQMDMSLCLRLLISGRVQGVWYRASTAQKATAMALKGWVRNLPDGRVEVLVQGEKQSLDALATWCHKGPPNARVDDVIVSQEPSTESLDDFHIAYTENV